MVDLLDLGLLKKSDFVITDLFCCAGGCSWGYYQAFIERYPNLLIVGVDINHQPRYPAFHKAEYSKNFIFIQADALDFITEYGDLFDLAHASPPCQKHSPLNYLHKQKDYPDLIEPTRKALRATGKPYVIENVPQAPLINPITLCGTMFQLDTVRHRAFETNPPVWFPPAPCQHEKRAVRPGRRPNRHTQYHCMTGHFSDVEWAREITGCHWMNQGELAEAIPPAYTEWLGEQLIEIIDNLDSKG